VADSTANPRSSVVILRGRVSVKSVGETASYRINGTQLVLKYGWLVSDGDEIIVAGKMKEDLFEVAALRNFTTGVVRPINSEPSGYINGGIALTLVGCLLLIVILAIAHLSSVGEIVILLGICIAPFAIPGVYLVREGQQLRDALQAVRSSKDPQ